MSIKGIIETDRDRFERHYRKVRGNVPDYVFDRGLSNDRYFVLAVQLDWELWQTAIAASGRDELLAELESLLCECVVVKANSTYATAQISTCAINDAREAIKKARGNP
jgi:hypothetical protein